VSGLLAKLAALGDITGFESPGLGVALGVLVLLALVAAARARPRTLAWPALAEARASGARPRDWLRAAALALRAGALVLVVMALAGPLGPAPSARPREEGLDLLLAVDTSGSMRALDAELGGSFRTRLELAREVVARFALHRVAAGDRVGLIVFGESAFTHCPLTSDGRLLRAALDRIEPGMAGEATALGDALALAVKRLHLSAPRTAVEGSANLGPASEARSEPKAGGVVETGVVVLLTDGRSNAGAVPPELAAALAAQLGVRAHTVGIGGEGEVAMAARGGARALATERHDLDAATLERIAATSGGRFFRAQSASDLGTVYEAIDRIERVAREGRAERLGEPEPEPALAAAGLLLALEILATRVLGRRLP
jgi:Ca-activated chloride channel family protein